MQAAPLSPRQPRCEPGGNAAWEPPWLPAGERSSSSPSASPRPGLQPHRSLTALKASALGPCQERLGSTMLTAVRREPAATRPTALGLLEGRTGCRARPSAGTAAAPGRTRLQGCYTRAGKQRCMAPRARTPCVPHRLGVAPMLLDAQDIAGCCSPPRTSPCCRMCPSECFSHQGCQPWHQLETGLPQLPAAVSNLALGQRLCAQGDNICGD